MNGGKRTVIGPARGMIFGNSRGLMKWYGRTKKPMLIKASRKKNTWWKGSEDISSVSLPLGTSVAERSYDTSSYSPATD